MCLSDEVKAVAAAATSCCLTLLRNISASSTAGARGRTGNNAIVDERMRVKSMAKPETLRELAMFSPVYDVVSNSVPVDVVVETY
jgi:hypothetical protein